MSSLLDVFVRVKPDTDNFDSDLKRRLGRIDGKSSGKSVASKFGAGMTGAMGGIAVKAAGVLAAGFAAVKTAQVFGGFIADAKEARKLSELTAAAIKSTGGAAKVTSKQVTDLASAIAAKTGIDDGAIQAGENLLLTFTGIRNEAGKGNDIFNQTTQIMTDMSAVLGTDAKGSAIQLGKALNDPVKGVSALSRVGVSFTKQQKDQIATLVKSGNTLGAQKVILKELSKEFGGAAEAAADPMAKLQYAAGEVGEAVGGLLLPAVDGFANFATGTLVPALQGVVDWVGPKLGAAFKSAQDVVAPVIGRIHDAISGLYDFVVRGDFTGAFRKAFGVEEDAPIIDRIFDIRDAIVNGLGDAKAWLVANVPPAFALVREKAGEAFDWLKANGPAALQAVSDVAQKFLIPALRDLGDFVANSLVPSLVNIGLTVARLQPIIEPLAKVVAGVLLEGFRAVAAIINNVLGPALLAVTGFLAQHETTAKVLATTILTLVGAYKVYTLTTAAVSAVTKAYLAQKQALILLSYNERVVALQNIAIKARDVVATVAQTVASKAAAAASKVWTAGQWLLNAALSANPIGIVIAAIAALTAGVIIAYKRSETFRSVVQAAWAGIRAAASFAWEKVLKPVLGFLWSAVKNNWEAFQTLRDVVGRAIGRMKSVVQTGLRGIVGFFFDAADRILAAADSMLGWIPGIGGQLKKAREEFRKARDSFNKSLGGVKSRHVTVSATLTGAATTVTMGDGSGRGGKTIARADGGILPGPPSERDNMLIHAASGEFVVRARQAAKHRAVLEAINAGRFQGLAAGGSVGDRFKVATSFNDPSEVGKFMDKQVGNLANVVAASLKKSVTFTGGVQPNLPGDYARVIIQGKTLNARTARMLGMAERLLGGTIRIMQGSYNRGGVAASGGTHDGGGVMDTSYVGSWVRTVMALRKVGFASWHRVPSQGPWGDHIHSVALGDRELSRSAANQARSFLAGGNGLGGRDAVFDSGGWLPPGRTSAYNGTGRPERVRTAEQEERLERLIRAVEQRGVAGGDTIQINHVPGYTTPRDIAHAQAMLDMRRNAGRRH